MKYRIERWLPPYLGADEVREADGRSTKYECALILLEWPEAMVRVEDLSNGRRYLAKVRPSGVALERIPDDGVALGSAADVEADRRASFLKRLAAEDNRKGRITRAKAAEKHARRFKFGKGVNRPVVCLDYATVFLSAAEAAEWNGVKRQSLQAAIAKGKPCGRLRFQYAAELLKELDDEFDRVTSVGRATDVRDVLSGEREALRPNHRALRKAAESAVFLQKREEVQEVPRSQADGPRDSLAN